jgi:phage terminase large subunit GpA-like protein
MKSDPFHRLRNVYASAILPPPSLLLADWARQKFRLSSDYSAVSGNFEPYPYQVEPLNVLSPSDPCDMMALMCGAQMMKTLLMMILLGFVIDVEPGPVLITQPSADDAKAFSAERVAPMLRDVPCLQGKVHEAKSRDSGNTILQKRFLGGSVALAGTVSPRGLRRRSVRFLLMDEVDGYDETRDGDPVALAAARTSKFWNRKIVLCSTPTIDGQSKIAKAYEASDQRLYFVPCPLCGEMQTLQWASVRWGFVEKGSDGKPDAEGRYIPPEDAHYQCAACEEFIPHHRKWEMLRSGEWRRTNPEGKYPGFRISRLYSPDWSWGKIVTDPAEGWLVAKKTPAAHRVFKNNVLAELWTEQGEAPDHEKLMARREPEYRLGQVPAGVLFLTAGVDVQKTWIEGYVYGWGRGRQRWVVDHFRIEKSPFEQAAWDELTTRLNQSYRRQGGSDLGIVRLAVDTGFASNEVYQWARQQGSGRVMPVDGRQHLAALVVSPTQVDVTVGGRRLKRGCKLWPVDTSACKSELYGLLGKERPAEGEPYPAGWVHFPADVDEEFFKQLTGEVLQTHVVKGYRKTEWIKIRERNEALDCCVYARAAAFAFGMDRHDHDARWWAIFDGGAGYRPPAPQPAATVASAPPPPQMRYPQQGRRRVFGRFGV